MGDLYGQRGAEADGWVERVSWNPNTNLKGSSNCYLIVSVKNRFNYF